MLSAWVPRRDGMSRIDQEAMESLADYVCKKRGRVPKQYRMLFMNVGEMLGKPEIRETFEPDQYDQICNLVRDAS
jgi:hypothetical protein